MYIQILGYPLYELLWIFVICSFIGWLLEVFVSANIYKKFSNRGILAGPYCPIEGVGAILATVFLTPLKGNVLVVFVVGVIITTILELTTGLALSRLFHNRWWSYSDHKHNYKGYIALDTSIGWGIGCLIFIYMFQPIFEFIISRLDNPLGFAVLFLILSIMLSDLIVTLVSLLKIRHRLTMLDALNKQLDKFACTLGTGFVESTKGAVQFNNHHIKDLEKKRDQYRELLAHHTCNFNRISKAFPNLWNKKFKKVLHPHSDVKTTKK